MARGYISQQNRFLEVSTPLGDTQFFITHFHGTESLSSPFSFSLSLVSNTFNIDTKALLGNKVTVKIHSNSNPRLFNGRVSRCISKGLISDELREYELILSPWLWFLNLDSDYRIFQDKTIPQIFTTICKERGFYDYDISNLKGKFKPKEYCVQYNETTLEFLNRILASEGIYYYFTHESNKHTMVLVDQNAIPKPIKNIVVYSNASYNEAHIHEWESQSNIHTNQFLSDDYNYETSGTSLKSKAPTNLSQSQILGSKKRD